MWLCFVFLLFATSLHLAVAQHNPNFVPGRSAIVHLFEWRWDDIAEECERFLGPYGFAGVQVSPVSENAAIWNQPSIRPWYERYQPVSYKMVTRSGNEDEFQAMVKRCNAAGVRIYVDAVMNHMTGHGTVGTGTAGTQFDANAESYPGVPYDASHFHGPNDCPTKSGNVENYEDVIQVRNCKLLGLNDLNQANVYVREKLVEFLNKMISYGVAGFRIDAAKHMWVSDLEHIYQRLDDLPIEHRFARGSRPCVYQEVIDYGGETVSSSMYENLGLVTEMRYGKFLGQAFQLKNPLKWLKNFGEAWSMLPSNDALIFINNHDTQRNNDADIVTFRQAKLLKLATAFMLAWPYGHPKIMSSFYWEQNMVNGQDVNTWIGPPHDGQYNTIHVPVNSDLTCGGGWICEHRWRQIYNMVRFRNAVGDENVVNWWDNGNYQIAFGRGSNGFIVINNDNYTLKQTLKTSMLGGRYCDVISGNLENGRCTGKTITVNDDGTAYVEIPNTDSDPMIAIHIQAQLL